MGPCPLLTLTLILQGQPAKRARTKSPGSENHSSDLLSRHEGAQAHLPAQQEEEQEEEKEGVVEKLESSQVQPEPFSYNEGESTLGRDAGHAQPPGHSPSMLDIGSEVIPNGSGEGNMSRVGVDQSNDPDGAVTASLVMTPSAPESDVGMSASINATPSSHHHHHHHHLAAAAMVGMHPEGSAPVGAPHTPMSLDGIGMPRSDEILVPALQSVPVTDPELLARIRHPSFQSGLAIMLQGDRHLPNCPGADAGPYNHTRDCTCLKRSIRPG